jgi:DNA polymerase III delta prime subunit
MAQDFSRFSGTDSYITSPELRHSVNVAAAIERPLLVRGEPGTGKTLLATAIAEDLGLELITWYVKSTSKSMSTTRSNGCRTVASVTTTCPTSASTSSSARSVAR